jgi:hypothetical protein
VEEVLVFKAAVVEEQLELELLRLFLLVHILLQLVLVAQLLKLLEPQVLLMLYRHLEVDVVEDSPQQEQVAHLVEVVELIKEVRLYMLEELQQMVLLADLVEVEVE